MAALSHNDLRAARGDLENVVRARVREIHFAIQLQDENHASKSSDLQQGLLNNLPNRSQEIVSEQQLYEANRGVWTVARRRVCG